MQLIKQQSYGEEYKMQNEYMEQMDQYETCSYCLQNISPIEMEHNEVACL